MMFVDASVLTAILVGEPDAPDLLARMERGTGRITSPLAIWETTIAVARVLRLTVPAAARAVEDFCALANIAIVPIDPATRAIAIDAYDRYGKSRHPAALNFGDCFAYACARYARVPLLLKGDDFGRTDIEVA
jgi:ribonuclease VapC